MTISEFIFNYTEKCTLNGGERVHLLQKTIASALAYAAPVYNGDISDSTKYYHEAVLPQSLKFISEFNERFVLDCDCVLHDVRLLWEGRYNTLNDFVYVPNFEQFHRSLNISSDISSKHEYWMRELMPYVHKHFEQYGE